MRLLESRPRIHPRIIGREIGLIRIAGHFSIAVLLQALWHHKPVAGQSDGGRDHILPRQVAKAAMDRCHAAHRARNTRRQIADQAKVWNHIALGIEIHIG